MMVLDYSENGSLRNFLDANYDQLNWKAMFRNSYYIALGLNTIHEIKFSTRSLRGRNYTKASDIYSFG